MTQMLSLFSLHVRQVGRTSERPQLEDALSLPLVLAPRAHSWSNLHECMARMLSLFIVFWQVGLTLVEAAARPP